MNTALGFWHLTCLGQFPAEASWRFNRLKIGEVDIADCLQGIGCCAVKEVVRQCVEPDDILRLQLSQPGEGRAVHADCRLARSARGSAAGLAFAAGLGVRRRSWLFRRSPGQARGLCATWLNSEARRHDSLGDREGRQAGGLLQVSWLIWLAVLFRPICACSYRCSSPE